MLKKLIRNPYPFKIKMIFGFLVDSALGSPRVGKFRQNIRIGFKRQNNENVPLFFAFPISLPGMGANR